MIRTIGDLIARAFTGKNLADIEQDAVKRELARRVKEYLPTVLSKFQQQLAAAQISDYDTDGYGFTASGETMQQIYDDEALNNTWQLYLGYLATFDYFNGNPQRLNSRAYRKAYEEAETAVEQVMDA